MASGAYMHTHTYTHIHDRMNMISRNQAHAGLQPARAWFKKAAYRESFKMHRKKERLELKEIIIAKSLEKYNNNYSF